MSVTSPDVASALPAVRAPQASSHGPEGDALDRALSAIAPAATNADTPARLAQAGE